MNHSSAKISCKRHSENIIHRLTIVSSFKSRCENVYESLIKDKPSTPTQNQGPVIRCWLVQMESKHGGCQGSVAEWSVHKVVPIKGPSFGPRLLSTAVLIKPQWQINIHLYINAAWHWMWTHHQVTLKSAAPVKHQSHLTLMWNNLSRGDDTRYITVSKNS